MKPGRKEWHIQQNSGNDAIGIWAVPWGTHRLQAAFWGSGALGSLPALGHTDQSHPGLLLPGVGCSTPTSPTHYTNNPSPRRLSEVGRGVGVRMSQGVFTRAGAR